MSATQDPHSPSASPTSSVASSLLITPAGSCQLPAHADAVQAPQGEDAYQQEDDGFMFTTKRQSSRKLRAGHADRSSAPADTSSVDPFVDFAYQAPEHPTTAVAVAGTTGPETASKGSETNFARIRAQMDLTFALQDQEDEEEEEREEARRALGDKASVWEKQQSIEKARQVIAEGGMRGNGDQEDAWEEDDGEYNVQIEWSDHQSIDQDEWYGLEANRPGQQAPLVGDETRLGAEHGAEQAEVDAYCEYGMTRKLYERVFFTAPAEQTWQSAATYGIIPHLVLNGGCGAEKGERGPINDDVDEQEEGDTRDGRVEDLPKIKILGTTRVNLPEVKNTWHGLRSRSSDLLPIDWRSNPIAREADMHIFDPASTLTRVPLSRAIYKRRKSPKPKTADRISEKSVKAYYDRDATFRMNDVQNRMKVAKFRPLPVAPGWTIRRTAVPMAAITTHDTSGPMTAIKDGEELLKAKLLGLLGKGGK